MATKRRRQVIYIDDCNIGKLETLKAVGALSKFVNWTLSLHFDAFLVKLWSKKKGKQIAYPE